MAKYDTLAAHLESRFDDSCLLTFEEIEALVGERLPPSARIYAAYWAGNQPRASVSAVGWKAALRINAGGVEFKRIGAAAESIAALPQPERAEGAQPDIILLGCVKTKRPGAHPARELYTSALWTKRMTYAERTGVPWFVLSAKHGLLNPDDVIESYDVSLVDASADVRQAWSQRVITQIDERLGDIDGKTIEIHAGDQYRPATLLGALRQRGAEISIPLYGLPFGSQLAWYDGGTVTSPRTPMSPPRTLAFGNELILRGAEGVAGAISEAFSRGLFDLSARPRAPAVSWDSMPEFTSARSLRGA